MSKLKRLLFLVGAIILLASSWRVLGRWFRQAQREYNEKRFRTR